MKMIFEREYFTSRLWFKKEAQERPFTKQVKKFIDQLSLNVHWRSIRKKRQPQNPGMLNTTINTSYYGKLLLLGLQF